MPNSCRWKHPTDGFCSPSTESPFSSGAMARAWPGRPWHWDYVRVARASRLCWSNQSTQEPTLDSSYSRLLQLSFRSMICTSSSTVPNPLLGYRAVPRVATEFFPRCRSDDSLPRKIRFMKKSPDQETIDAFAQRSDRHVMKITMAFALGGALMDIGAHLISSLFLSGGGVSMLWGMWIPLCFITIPPIHYLCRYIKNLQKRMEALEARIGER